MALLAPDRTGLLDARTAYDLVHWTLDRFGNRLMCEWGHFALTHDAMGKCVLLAFHPLVPVDDLPIAVATMTEMAELALLRLETRRRPRA
jgi:hypothetical protein